MTPESGLDRIQRLQKEKEEKLDRLARKVRGAAGGNHDLHKLAASLQNEAHQIYEARTLPGASVESTKEKPMQENPRYDPNAKTIPF